MVDFEKVIENLGIDVFPNAIQFVWVLMALVGVITIGFGLYNLYQIATEGPQPGQRTEGGAIIRMLIGGFMVIPSVTLWRAADVFLDGGTKTETSLLSYISGTGTVAGCDNFGRAITLGFMFLGALGLFRAFRNADDAAKGFNRDGYRTAVVYFFGGLGCFFINDIMTMVGNSLGYTIGFSELCTAIGGG